MLHLRRHTCNKESKSIMEREDLPGVLKQQVSVELVVPQLSKGFVHTLEVPMAFTSGRAKSALSPARRKEAIFGR